MDFYKIKISNGTSSFYLNNGMVFSAILGWHHYTIIKNYIEEKFGHGGEMKQYIAPRVRLVKA
jgi:ABC-type arginine transport system ATPase subunit